MNNVISLITLAILFLLLFIYYIYDQTVVERRKWFTVYSQVAQKTGLEFFWNERCVYPYVQGCYFGRRVRIEIIYTGYYDILIPAWYTRVTLDLKTSSPNKFDIKRKFDLNKIKCVEENISLESRFYIFSKPEEIYKNIFEEELLLEKFKAVNLGHLSLTGNTLVMEIEGPEENTDNLCYYLSFLRNLANLVE